MIGPVSWLLTQAGNNRKEENLDHSLPGRQGVKGRERHKDNVRENTFRTWTLELYSCFTCHCFSGVFVCLGFGGFVYLWFCLFVFFLFFLVFVFVYLLNAGQLHYFFESYQIYWYNYKMFICFHECCQFIYLQLICPSSKFSPPLLPSVNVILP